jgi:hypothetical protein
VPPLAGVDHRGVKSPMILIALLAACSRGNDTLQIVHPCQDTVAVDTAGWTRRQTTTGSILLPANFAIDSSAVFGLSGTRWRDGDRTIDDEKGYWDSTAFRPRRRGERMQMVQCYFDIDSRRTLLSTALVAGEYSAAAWPVAAPADSDKATTALVARGKSRDDQMLFLRAMLLTRWSAPSPSTPDD